MSNCLPSTSLDGGQITNTTIINAKIIESKLISPEITGGISLDTATAIALAELLCTPLNSCIEEALRHILSTETIDSVSFTNADISHVHLMGSATLDAGVVNDVHKALADKISNDINTAIGAALKEVIQGLSVNGLSLTGGITLDDNTLATLVNRMKTSLEDSLGFIVKDGGVATSLTITTGSISTSKLTGNTIDSNSGKDNTFTNTTLVGGTLQGSFAVGSETAQDLASTLADYILDELKKSGALNDLPLLNPDITGGTLTDTKLVTPAISDPTISGTISMPADTSNKLAEQLAVAVLSKLVADKLFKNIELDTPVITGGTASGVTNTDTTFNGTTNVSGSFKLDKDAADGLVGDLAEKIIKFGEDNNLWGSLTLNGANITGSVTLDKDALDSLLSKLTSVSGAWKVLGGTVSNTSGADNDLTNTTLDGSTAIKGSVLLDTEAATDICTAIKGCVVNAVLDELAKQCTQIVSPDMFPAVNQTPEISTRYYGTSQDIRLGQPTGFMDIGGYLVPYYAKGK